MIGISEYLNYAIHAVSLAYLWPESYSEYSLAQARQYYGMTLKSLKTLCKVLHPHSKYRTDNTTT